MGDYESIGARLTLPFTARGTSGRVQVMLRRNDDPTTSGHDLVFSPGSNLAALQGFPIITARIEMDAPGLSGVFGWVQLVTQRLALGRIERTIDAADFMAPFCAFGHLPTFLDAPANPGDADMTWGADTFLVALPDVSVTRVLQPLAGFRWGYQLVGGRPARSLPLAAADGSGWRDLRVVLERDHPGWRTA